MKIRTVTTFIPVPARKPLNVPSAAFNAFLKSELSWINSPISAPRNGPKIIKIGVKKNPATKPTTEPIVPALLPPLFFVNIEGKILSKIETATAKIPVKIKTQTFIWLNEIQCANSKPAHASGAPGITGTTVPINPIIKSELEIITRIMSAVIFFVKV